MLKNKEIRANMAIVYAIVDKLASKGVSTVSQGFMSACEELTDQMSKHPAIDNLTFKHEDYGDDITVYIRRHEDDFLVSLEAKDFTVED